MIALLLRIQDFNCVAFLLASTVISAEAFAAPVEYRLEGTPRANRVCQDDADAVAAKFAAVGVKILSASCVKEDALSAEISVFLDGNNVPSIYSAVFAQRVEPLSTFNSSSTPINHRHDLHRAIGLFATHQACLANVAMFKASFEQHTGLSAIAAQCISLGFGSGHAMQIDGFGEPLQRLATYGQTFFTNLLDGSLVEKITGSLQNSGFELIDIRWVGDSLLAIGWGDPNLPLQSVDFNGANYFDTRAECESQRTDLVAFMAGNGRNVFHAECEKTYSRPMLMILEEIPATSELPILIFEKFGRFSGFNACIARIPPVSAGSTNGYFCSLDVAFNGSHVGYRLNQVSLVRTES